PCLSFFPYTTLFRSVSINLAVHFENCCLDPLGQGEARGKPFRFAPRVNHALSGLVATIGQIDDPMVGVEDQERVAERLGGGAGQDRKSTRLNSSHQI